MKLLFRFFQVMCLIQLSAVGQLNAHPDMKSGHAFVAASCSESHLHNLVALQDQSDDKVIAHNTHLGEIFSVGFENIDEKDYEPEAAKKSLVTKNYFALGFYHPLASYLSHNDENNLVFSRQSFLVPTNRRHVILQVFRI